MMNKAQSAKVHLIRFLFMLPLLAVILLAFRNTRQQSENKAGLLKTDTVPASSKNVPVLIKDDVHKVTTQYADVMVVQDVNNTVKKDVQVTVRNEVNGAVKNNMIEYRDLKVVRDTVPAPPPPPPPAKSSLPENVKNISIIKSDKGHGTITITLKDGRTEKYDMGVPAEKEAFEKKYGALPEAPVPPPPSPANPSPKATPVPPPPPVPPAVVKKEHVVLTADTIIFDTNKKTTWVNVRITNCNEIIVKTRVSPVVTPTPSVEKIHLKVKPVISNKLKEGPEKLPLILKPVSNMVGKSQQVFVIGHPAQVTIN